MHVNNVVHRQQVKLKLVKGMPWVIKCPCYRTSED